MNTQHPTKPIDERVLLQGDRFDVHEMTLAGRDGRTYTRQVVRHPGAVVLLPLMDHDTIVMIENARASVGETLLELPAGTREPNESPKRTAIRELAEETGYKAGSIQCVHEFYSAPGISDELMHLFVARELTAGQHAREAVEHIENRIVHRNEVLSLLSSGKIRDGKSLIGLYYFLHMIEKQ